MNQLMQRNGICYVTEKEGYVKKQRPWLNSVFAPFYDWLMKHSVFPKKFNASYAEHFRILKSVFQDVHQKNVLEVGTGSGNVVYFLPPDNRYHGVDISEGLLMQAYKKLKKHGFSSVNLYLTDACTLPFDSDFFDMVICNLSLNFIENTEAFVTVIKRVLKPGALFVCSVPAPERLTKGAKVRGTLHTEKELKEIFESRQFLFQTFPETNGAILYFRASL